MPYARRRTRRPRRRGIPRRTMRAKRPGAWRRMRRRRAKKLVSTKVRKISRKVNKLVRRANDASGILRYRKIGNGGIPFESKKTGQFFLPCMSKALINDVVGNLRYYEPLAPTQLRITSLNTGGDYQRGVTFSPSWTRLFLRNNYSVASEVSVYFCYAKKDLDADPITLGNDIPQDVGNGTLGRLFVTPSDFPTLLKYWSFKRVRHKILAPGQGLTVTRKIPGFLYDTSYTQDSTQEYCRVFKSCGFYVRIHGVLAHKVNSGTGEITYGYPAGQVDYAHQINYKIMYEAGQRVRYLATNDDSVALVNATGIDRSYTVSVAPA